MPDNFEIIYNRKGDVVRCVSQIGYHVGVNGRRAKTWQILGKDVNRAEKYATAIQQEWQAIVAQHTIGQSDRPYPHWGNHSVYKYIIAREDMRVEVDEGFLVHATPRDFTDVITCYQSLLKCKPPEYDDFDVNALMFFSNSLLDYYKLHQNNPVGTYPSNLTDKLMGWLGSLSPFLLTHAVIFLQSLEHEIAPWNANSKIPGGRLPKECYYILTGERDEERAKDWWLGTLWPHFHKPNKKYFTQRLDGCEFIIHVPDSCSICLNGQEKSGFVTRGFLKSFHLSRTVLTGKSRLIPVATTQGLPEKDTHYSMLIDVVIPYSISRHPYVDEIIEIEGGVFETDAQRQIFRARIPAKWLVAGMKDQEPKSLQGTALKFEIGTKLSYPDLQIDYNSFRKSMEQIPLSVIQSQIFIEQQRNLSSRGNLSAHRQSILDNLIIKGKSWRQ